MLTTPDTYSKHLRMYSKTLGGFAPIKQFNVISTHNYIDIKSNIYLYKMPGGCARIGQLYNLTS